MSLMDIPRSIRWYVVDRRLGDLNNVKMRRLDEIMVTIPDVDRIMAIDLLCPFFHSAYSATRSSMEVMLVLLVSDMVQCRICARQTSALEVFKPSLPRIGDG